jgi:hypothetical protein
VPATYDPTTSVGTVRLLISDVDTAAALFDDEEVTRFLTLSSDDQFRAAALALDTIAANEALVAKRIETHGLTLDGPAVARALREQAASLREQAEAEDVEGGFLIASNVDGYDWP